MKDGWIVCGSGPEGFASWEFGLSGGRFIGDGRYAAPGTDGVSVGGILIGPGRAARVGAAVYSCLPARFGTGGIREARLGRMAGASDAMLEVMHSAAAAALSNASVLILGESGTGKELVAEYLGSIAGSMHGINMGAVPGDLAEAELFGWMRGSFTGAIDSRAGALEAAGCGVLFLDEIGEAPAWVQVKLLRALDTRKFRRLGGGRDVELKARVVAATNLDPIEGIASGRLRLDLLERLACHVIRMPPLRSRPADIPCLLRLFSAAAVQGVRDQVPQPSPQVIDLLRRWPWHGNVREFRNVVERVMLASLDGMSSERLVNAALEQGRVFHAPGCDEASVPASSRADEISASGLPRSTYYYRLKRGRIPSDQGPRRSVTASASRT